MLPFKITEYFFSVLLDLHSLGVILIHCPEGIHPGVCQLVQFKGADPAMPTGPVDHLGQDDLCQVGVTCFTIKDQGKG